MQQENTYLEKHALWPPQISTSPPDDLGMVVVIPAYCEDRVLSCLQSLSEAETLCNATIEVLVIINHPQDASAQEVQLNDRIHLQVDAYAKVYNRAAINFHSFLIGALPARKGGVGMARKIGMDEAVRRFLIAGRAGPIVNLDADCLVRENYFSAIAQGFLLQPEMWAASIYFEHDLSSPELSPDDNQAICDYELHLRYFIAAQGYIGLPFAFQTVGSSMAVRSNAYQKMGGMNTRKAGEDFYFLHKFSAINRLGVINDTIVYPSARASHRVPFGTGRAVQSLLSGAPQLTYNFSSFLMLSAMIEALPALYEGEAVGNWIHHLPIVVRTFFDTAEIQAKLVEIRSETNRYETFINRFYQWFNAFRLMKYLHQARDTFPDLPVYQEALNFCRVCINAPVDYNPDSATLLRWYRDQARTRDV